nr:arginine biosynthesis bifunctional protein ArgJ, chloroplastic [Tanacetum cinerariifolium]
MFLCMSNQQVFVDRFQVKGLTKSIAWDGEGVTCLVEVTVTGAGSEADAAKIAHSVASSSLTKAAIYSRDPNWGRIACAAGSAASSSSRRLVILMAPSNFQISIGDGPGTGTAWGCDLSYDYVKINAEYTT